MREPLPPLPSAPASQAPAFAEGKADQLLLKSPPPGSELDEGREEQHQEPRSSQSKEDGHSLLRWVQWFTPGIGVKRWLLLVLLGAIAGGAGACLSAAYTAVEWSVDLIEWFSEHTGRVLNTEVVGAILLALGVLATLVGARGAMRAVERAYASTGHTQDDFLETALKHRERSGHTKIVAIGGGTGLSTMLRGLKKYSSRITAVVTMADDGGSSGELREHGMLPPGDLRNCIAALAESEPLMVSLFQHRFESGPFKGHPVGNIILTAMVEIEDDYEKAVQSTSKVLAIRGRVLPSTVENIRMGATLSDNTEVLGQKNIGKAGHIERVFLIPDSPRALPAVIEAIEDAEVIIIGPGSLFTSLIPNLLVPDIARAIKSSKAPKIYVCNVMTQPGETSSFKASDHVAAIIRHIGSGVITHALVNNGHVKPKMLEKYEAVGAEYVEPDEASIEMLGVGPIHGNFIDDSNLVRHNSRKLAASIFKVITKM